MWHLKMVTAQFHCYCHYCHHPPHFCDDNSSASQCSLYLTGRNIQLRGVHNIATWVLHLMQGFQTWNIKFLEILICTEPPETSILFVHSMQINNHYYYYYYGNNMLLVINNTTKLSCMYFTTSSLFHSLAFICQKQ